MPSRQQQSSNKQPRQQQGNDQAKQSAADRHGEQPAHSTSGKQDAQQQQQGGQRHGSQHPGSQAQEAARQQQGSRQGSQQRSQQQPDDMSRERGPSEGQQVQGEGDYRSNEKYTDDVQSFVASGKVDEAARNAKPRSQQEADDMRRAEQEGASHAKGDDTMPQSRPSADRGA